MIPHFKPSKAIKAIAKSKHKRSKSKQKERSVVIKQRRKHYRELSIEKMNGATYSWQIRDNDLIDKIVNARLNEIHL